MDFTIAHPHTELTAPEIRSAILKATDVDIGEGFYGALTMYGGRYDICMIRDDVVGNKEEEIQAVLDTLEHNDDWELLAMTLNDLKLYGYTLTTDEAILLVIGMATTNARVIEILKGAELI